MKAMTNISAGIVWLVATTAIADQSSPAGKTKEKDAAYEQAVQKCNAQNGAAKQQCIEAAKEKYGEMLK